MFSRLFTRNNSRIKNGSNNTVIQGNQFDGPVILAGGDNAIDVLAAAGKYDLIQQMVTTTLEKARKKHPLYPEFSATYNQKLQRLVSTPETDTAFKNHRKSIKGSFQINYAQYPHMDKSETPWDYAYRTQTRVELKTTAYKEYLGDMEDPFPVLTFSEGMKTIIGAPEFPDAIEARLISGEVEVPIQFRRYPCFEYGYMLFGNTSNNHGFDIRIRVKEQPTSVTVSFTKTEGASLCNQLLREQLLANLYETRLFRIMIGEGELLSATVSDNDANNIMFRIAKPLSLYIKSLIKIEEKLGCKFELEIGDITPTQYYAVLALAKSLDDEWLQIKMDFDNEIRCDYNHIDESVVENKSDCEYYGEFGVPDFEIHGVLFSADTAAINYKEARINNLDSVRRNIKRKKKRIMITMRPKGGNDYFIKSIRYWGITAK